MKRIILFLTALALCVSMAACGQKAPAIPDDAVTIVIPPEFAGAETQNELTERYSEHGYLEARLTEEGSVVLTMTAEKHAQLLADTETSIRENLAAMIGAEDNRFTKIEASEDFTHYDVYLPAEEPELGETFYVLSFLFSSSLYYVVLGEEMPEMTVDFINELTGDIIYTYPEPTEG